LQPSRHPSTRARGVATNAASVQDDEFDDWNEAASEAYPITTSDASTESVRVEVRAQYSPEHSDPTGSEWFFLYTIRITNESDQKVQLLNRHWLIQDATGKSQEVRGPGVVGEQPELDPGQSFEYTSGCPLPTPFGSMQGSYEMVREGGELFNATIARFDLRQPSALH
jgi:ApaG protein